MLIAGSLVLTSGGNAALAQPVEGYVRAFVAIPLGRPTDGPAYGLRLDLWRRDSTEPGDLGPPPNDPPPELEVRFGWGDAPGDLRLAGIAPTEARDRLGLDGGATLWVWAGLGLAAVVAIVIAADAICIGINTGCSTGKNDDDDKGDGLNQARRQ